MKDQRTALGNGTASSPMPPSPRPGVAAHRSNFGSGSCPQARIAGHLTFWSFAQFRARCGFLFCAIQIAQRCHPFATYRRVSCSPAATICGCIAKRRKERQAGLQRWSQPQPEKVRGRTIHIDGLFLPLTGGRPSVGLYSMQSRQPSAGAHVDAVGLAQLLGTRPIIDRSMFG
jgi:hypothetical protein